MEMKKKNLEEMERLEREKGGEGGYKLKYKQ